MYVVDLSFLLLKTSKANPQVCINRAVTKWGLLYLRRTASSLEKSTERACTCLLPDLLILIQHVRDRIIHLFPSGSHYYRGGESL